MHRNETRIADLYSAVAINYDMRTEKYIPSETNCATEGVKNDALFDPCAIANIDASQISRIWTKLAVNTSGKLTRTPDGYAGLPQAHTPQSLDNGNESFLNHPEMSWR